MSKRILGRAQYYVVANSRPDSTGAVRSYDPKRPAQTSRTQPAPKRPPGR